MAVMNGTDAMRVLRSDPSFAHVPIIALTAQALDGERRAALAAGFDEVIAKPCLPDDLARAVKRILANKSNGNGNGNGTGASPDRLGAALYWSKRGMVACAGHAPAAETERWRAEAWQPVPEHHRSGDGALQCQFCHGRPYVRMEKDTDIRKIQGF
jgi:DNA-binding response OmpR family regulator